MPFNQFLLGLNYWSQSGALSMWERFDLQRIDAELQNMQRMGCNACRCFVFAPSFMPAPPAVDATMLTRFGKFLDLCEQHGVRALPSILVGHMSGQNFDFPGQAGRSLYSDPELRAWQAALCEAVAGVGAKSRAVAAWVLSNEMPLWGGRAEVSAVRDWAQHLCAVVRAASPGIPIGTGDGVMNLKGEQNGFDPAVLAEIVDYFGPHSYYADRDSLRQGLHVDFLIRATQAYGKPVLLEEFGASRTQASELAQAALFREAMSAAYTLGAAGALAWCYGDFDSAYQLPYAHHAFELGFGVVRSDGSAKPAAQEIARVAALARPGLLRPPDGRVAIVLPSYFWRNWPFSWEDRTRMRATLLQCFAMATLSGLDPLVVPEELVSQRDDVALWLAPCTQKLLAPTWEALLRHVYTGATFYASYYASDFDFHQGLWWHEMEQAIGARHQLRYGVLDSLGDSLTLVAGRRTLLRVPVPPPYAAEPFRASYLPVEPLSARVLARDTKGRPMLLCNAVGQGRVIFCAAPVEYLLTVPVEANAAPGVATLYTLIAQQAGLAVRPVAPGVQVRSAGDQLVLLNRTWQVRKVPATRLPAGPWTLPNGKRASGTVLLEPKGVIALRRG